MKQVYVHCTISKLALYALHGSRTAQPHLAALLLPLLLMLLLCCDAIGYCFCI
jgi:hypothetical protein